MKEQPNRIAAEGDHHLRGSAIDRSHPLKFRLDGKAISGFAGDTVLSATLASGIDTLGQRDGTALSLSPRHAPGIVPASQAGNSAAALPMIRTPALDGVDYVSVGHTTGGILRKWSRSGRRSLRHDLDRPDALARSWLGTAVAPGPDADMVVVGGGIAGMSTALAAAKRGLRVVLIEAAPHLGGTARLFGTQDGEETPDQAITRLVSAVAEADAVSVVTATEVFALRPGVVRAHRVELQDGTPQGSVIELRARYIVLATGALERLPVFPGNRLPGVAGAMEAFELARLYGIWPGRSTVIATSSSPVYRLAMLARDAGIEVPRILDSRPQPQSRFIEFSKAYGITLVSGSLIASASPAPKQNGLLVLPQVSIGDFTRAEAPLTSERLIVCGGWQPDLMLWHIAGGTSGWNPKRSRLEPGSGPEGVALAGSAGGWLSRRACLASGGDAVNKLLNRPRRQVEEALIDPIYESPDGPAPLGDNQPDDAAPAFLDSGMRYIERPRQNVSRWPAWLPFAPRPAGWSLADTPRPLEIAEIVAGVQLGAIPAASAGIVAQERVAMVMIADADTSPERPDRPAALMLPPPYLAGRYEGAELWLAAPDERRTLDTGALIYGNADETDPRRSTGVVVSVVEKYCIVLIAGRPGQTASVREHGRAITIKLLAPYRPGMDLAATLSGSAGTA